MPINRVCKINSLNKMMMEFFWNSEDVSKSTLDARVDSDIIAVAMEEGLITLKLRTPRNPNFLIENPK